jgi:hypothetical protein
MAQDYPEELPLAPDDDDGAGGAGFAPSENDEAVPEALALYQLGEQAYDQGRYEEAVEYLIRARALDPRAPELLYNIALVYEKMNDFDQALSYLEQYLDSTVNANEAARVERMMARLRGAREHATQVSPARPPVAHPPAQATVSLTHRPSPRVVRRGGRTDGWFWGFFASSLVVAAGAAAMGALALIWEGRANDFVLGRDGGQQEHHGLARGADNFALTTDVLVGTASATALTAFLLFVLRDRAVPETETEPTPTTGRERRWGGRGWPVFSLGAGRVVAAWEM